MIINLIHTLTLATSVGLGAVAPSFENEEKQPIMEVNRSVENTNFSINITQQQSKSRNFEINTTPFYDGIANPTIYENVYKYSINGTQLNGDIIRLTARTYITAGDPYTAIIAKQKRNVLNVIGKVDKLAREADIGGENREWYWKNMPVNQTMYIARIKTNQNIINTKILANITKNNVYGSGYQDSTKLLITRNNMENYFTNTMYDNYGYYTNNNLYDTYVYIKENVLKYTGQEYNQLIEMQYDALNETGTIEREINFQTTNDNKYTYLIYYAEEQKIIANNQEAGYLEERYHPETYNSFTIQGKQINAVIEYEEINIGGVMFDILGMPFTFISVAFNLTLFPNTPYSVNISTLFLSIFAVIVFVFIVKLILGAVGKK